MYEWNNLDTVEGWNATHLESHDVSVTNEGELMMMPYTSSWYEDYRGVLLFKEITGNFVFTTEITTTNRAGSITPPSTNFSLAGMMIRTATEVDSGALDWVAGQENYVFLSIGRADGSAPYQLEVKTTVNGNSNLVYSPIIDNNIFMRMVRIDNAILVLHSQDNVNWTLHRRYDRADFPFTVQIGFVTYTDWPHVSSLVPIVQNSNTLNSAFDPGVSWEPDLIGRFGFARFDEVTVPAALQGLDFSNSSQVSEAEIINFLAYSSTEQNPSTAKVWLGTQSVDWNNAGNWLGGAIPLAGEEVIIANCSCPEVNIPSLTSDSPILAGLRLEANASLVVPSGVTLNIDLANAAASFINEGNINNLGSIVISSSAGKEVRNVQNMLNHPGAVFRVEE